jgi:MFS family permease
MIHDTVMITWVVNAYLITFGSFLLVAGRLGDLIGRRRVLLIGLTVFTAASALCGLAQGAPVLHHRGKGGRGASSVRGSAIVARRAEGGLSKRP